MNISYTTSSIVKIKIPILLLNSEDLYLYTRYSVSGGDSMVARQMFMLYNFGWLVAYSKPLYQYHIFKI